MGATALSKDELAAAMWAAVQKLAGKELNRDKLTAGGDYHVWLSLSGLVNKQAVRKTISADLSVGHDSVRASPKGADQTHVVAWLLSKVNTATRRKILQEAPEEFARSGNKLPELSPELMEAARLMLSRLRAKVEQPVRGSISCRYQLEQ